MEVVEEEADREESVPEFVTSAGKRAFVPAYNARTSPAAESEKN